MDEGLHRARNRNQPKATQCQWQRRFVGASEWRCGPKAARQSEMPGRQAAKGRTRPDERSRWSRLPVKCSTGKEHAGLSRARAALRGHGKNRSESGVGCRKKIFPAGTAIVGGDSGRYTSDESPRRNREVANPHVWPVRAKIRSGEREPTLNSDLGGCRQPTQANTGGRRGTSAKPRRPG